jgi:hypothetical protein
MDTKKKLQGRRMLGLIALQKINYAFGLKKPKCKQKKLFNKNVNKLNKIK